MLRWDNRGGFIVLLNLFHAVGKCVSAQLILNKAENSSKSCHVKRGHFRKEYPCKELLSISIWPCDPNIFQIHRRHLCAALMRKLLRPFPLPAFQNNQKELKGFQKHASTMSWTLKSHVCPQVKRTPPL